MILVADPIGMSDFDKHMIFSPVVCGHFEPGPLSETCFNDSFFHLPVRRQQLAKSQNIKFDMKINSCIISKFHLVSIIEF